MPIGLVLSICFLWLEQYRDLVLSELYPTKEALDAAGTGAQDALSETFGQLDELLVTLSASR